MNYILRRTRTLRVFPKSGFVIYNEEAENEMFFYCRVSTTKTVRTTYWTELPIEAKIFKTEALAKAVLSKMKKRNKGEKYAFTVVRSIESLMIEAWEIDCRTQEVQQCKAWPVEQENGSVFKTMLEAIQSELDARNKEKVSFMMNVHEAVNDIKKLETMRLAELERQRNLIPKALEGLKAGKK